MAKYRYEGDQDLQFDEANDDYSLVMVMGDEYTIYPHGKIYVVHHDSSPEIDFRLQPKEAKILLKASRELLDVEVDPANPPYLLFEPKFELVDKIYRHYNKLLFGNKCPPIKLRKSRNSKVWGMAKMEYLNNNINKPVFTFFINESAMIDRKLFTNTIIHEMIHLYLFKSGAEKYSSDPEQAMAEINASHGPLFQREMHRVNAFGFGVITAGTHEEIARAATEDFYAIVAERAADNGLLHWSGWYTHYELTGEDLDKLASLMKLQFPYENMHIYLVKTKSREITAGGVNLKASKNFPAASLSKMYKGAPPLKDATKLDERYLRASTKVTLPSAKEEPELYALPFNKFITKMKKYTDDHAVLMGVWKAAPLRTVNKVNEERLKTLSGRVRRKAISEPDLVNLLIDIKASYEERFDFDDYVRLVTTVLAKHDAQGELVPYYRIMRLPER